MAFNREDFPYYAGFPIINFYHFSLREHFRFKKKTTQEQPGFYKKIKKTLAITKLKFEQVYISKNPVYNLSTTHKFNILQVKLSFILEEFIWFNKIYW